MPIEEDYDFLFKTVIVGDTNVGKTQILSRFIQNQFNLDSKPTVGVQFGTKTIKVGDVWVKNQIWDTAGQQKFRALTCAYYRGAIGAIVVFDLSKSVTFEHVQRWIKEVKEYSEPQVSILLIGNKNDLQSHEVRQEDIQNFAADHKLLYVSTSAATGQNIELAFDTLIKRVVPPQEDKISVDSEPQNEPVEDKKVEQSLSKNDSKQTNPSQSAKIQKRKTPVRQKPRIQTFSIEDTDKIKIKDQKNNKKLQPKKKCC